MIGRLRGILIEKQPPYLLIDVQGVGYEVAAPMITFYHLPELLKEVTLYTTLIVREDAHQLYGFSDKTQQTLFRTLLKVNGVGAKLALAILSSMEPQAFVQSIMNQDVQGLTKLPGIGKKTAERLVLEMQDRLKDWGNEFKTDLGIVFTMPSNSMSNSTPLHEALSALVSLGYKQQEATKMVQHLDTQNMSSEEIIKQALRGLR